MTGRRSDDPAAPAAAAPADADRPASWEASAQAWIGEMGDSGDFARRFVLDPVMLAQLDPGAHGRALDVGCGEGRFCRMMRDRGILATGIDPTAALLAAARARDPGGDYQLGRAEALTFDDDAFDLVVSYLTLIDIDDAAAAIAEMARVLRPGGTLLIANLANYTSSGGDIGWIRNEAGDYLYFPVDRYLECRGYVTQWREMKIVNHHRPLSVYFKHLLGAGLRLTLFDEPPAVGGPEDKRARYNRAPWFQVMAWRKPEG